MLSLRKWLFYVTAAGAAAAIAGCGGGGDPLTRLTGVVTDIDGKAVSGATVSCAGKTTTSLSNGSFQLSGLADGFRTVSSWITIGGRRWSGETRVDLAVAEANRSVNVVVSDDRYHARIQGTVIDNNGWVVSGAKVFVQGPWGSTLAIADSNGSYQVSKLTPGVTYELTCSLAGYTNDSRSVYLGAGDTKSVSFALGDGVSQGAIPAPKNVAAQAWTIASSISRASPAANGAVDWLKGIYRVRRGLPSAPRAVVSEPGVSRATPSGSLIEVDLFWDYASYNDLLGYAVKRGVASRPSAVNGILRDPLASAYFDIDSALTPDTTYYYTVHGLDTVDFASRNLIGPASNEATARPLEGISALAPAQSGDVYGDPTFRWSTVYRARSYQIVVWDRFPDLQNPQDSQGVVPMWPADLNNPGNSRVLAPSNSLVYDGPYLQSGRTYYWVVIAADDGEYALSVSPVRKFIAR